MKSTIRRDEWNNWIPCAEKCQTRLSPCEELIEENCANSITKRERLFILSWSARSSREPVLARIDRGCLCNYKPLKYAKYMRQCDESFVPWRGGCTQKMSERVCVCVCVWQKNILTVLTPFLKRNVINLRSVSHGHVEETNIQLEFLTRSLYKLVEIEQLRSKNYFKNIGVFG